MSIILTQPNFHGLILKKCLKFEIRSSLGTDRSSMFVTLYILVQQLRLEKKVDVCTFVRKLRSQRSQFLSTYVSISLCEITDKMRFFSFSFHFNSNFMPVGTI